MIGATRRFTRVLPVTIGFTAATLFVIMYIAEFFPHEWPTVTLTWVANLIGWKGMVAANIVSIVAFIGLLPYRRPTRALWKSRGLFIAFVIALMTEMLGWPLLLFFVSPFFDLPQIVNPYYAALGHWPATIGMFMVFGGLALIIVGWRQIFYAHSLVTTGIYARIRHPQYAGILLFTLGWVIDYPSLVTLALWPFLAYAYIRLSRFEEIELARDYGPAYVQYCERIPRFLPDLWPPD